MGAENDPCRPATLTLMGGPVDTRASPTGVNDIAMPGRFVVQGQRRGHGSAQLPGRRTQGLSRLPAARRVHFDEPRRHMMSHYEMFKHLTLGHTESAGATKTFYDEYLSVSDMTAEFYLETIEQVFQKHALPKGEFIHRGKPIEPSAIRDTALLAIEGERDDISGIGQTRASLDLANSCRGLRRSTSSPGTSATTASSTAASGARRSHR